MSLRYFQKYRLKNHKRKRRKRTMLSVKFERKISAIEHLQTSALYCPSFGIGQEISGPRKTTLKHGEENYL
jgi:hypothetical protein